MNPKTKVVLVLAYGDLLDDHGLGHPTPTADQDGSVLRFYTTLEPLTPRDTNVVIVATAGYTKKSPSIPVPERRVSLADQFYEWARQQPPDWQKRIECDGRYWGTRSEIWTGIKLAQQHGASPRDKVEIRVGTSDNWCHYLRVKLYVWLYKPWRWKMRVIRSKHQLNTLEKAGEVLKLLDSLFTLLLHPIGIRRIRTLTPLTYSP